MKLTFPYVDLSMEVKSAISEWNFINWIFSKLKTPYNRISHAVQYCVCVSNLIKSNLNEASDIKLKPRSSSSVATNLLFLDCLNMEKESQECFESFGVQVDCHHWLSKPCQNEKFKFQTLEQKCVTTEQDIWSCYRQVSETAKVDCEVPNKRW